MTESSSSPAARYPIRVVARRAGITTATLRAWERRYGAVDPARTEGNRRLFSEADIERLTLLRRLGEHGHSISAVAPLRTDELRRMATAEGIEPGDTAGAPAPALPVRSAALTASCHRAVRAMDAGRLHRMLMRGMIELGPAPYLDELVVPLCRWIGDEWQAGSITEAHEHVASQSIRQGLGFLLGTLRTGEGSRRMIATTVEGERHEFGAMMAASVAAMGGWSVTYLGADLPAATVAATARTLEASVVALSVVTTEQGRSGGAYLRELRRRVGRDVTLIVGGAGAAALDDTLGAVRAERVDDLSSWRARLSSAGRTR